MLLRYKNRVQYLSIDQEMDATQFARELSSWVVIAPPIAYAVLLLNSIYFIELIAVSFLFFAFLPQYFVGEFQKMPRNPKTKMKGIEWFLITFVLGFFVQWALNAPPVVLAFSISLVVGHLIAYVITPHWMISTHAMMTAQPLAVLAVNGRIESVALLVIFVAMGWARVHLKAHTPMQYLTGGTVGAALTLAALAGVVYI